MYWNCESCGTDHRLEEQRVRCRRRVRREKLGTALFLVAFVAVMAIPVLVWNEYAYGDWKCTFMHCVKVTR